ncbi:hypothetical protein FOL47_009040, partial [Perkinsus chesapeaki]
MSLYLFHILACLALLCTMPTKAEVLARHLEQSESDLSGGCSLCKLCQHFPTGKCEDVLDECGQDCISLVLKGAQDPLGLQLRGAREDFCVCLHTELQAELRRDTSSDCTALADELSELVNQWRTRSQDNPTVSSDTSTSSALADIDSANRQMLQLEHILGIRPDTPIHHIEDLHKKAMKLLRKTLYLEKQMCHGSEGRSAVGSPEILRASEAISGVIEVLLSKNAPERQGTTEE